MRQNWTVLSRIRYNSFLKPGYPENINNNTRWMFYFSILVVIIAHFVAKKFIKTDNSLR